MKRLTEKNEFGDYVGSNLLDDECLCRGLSFDEMNEMTKCFNKLGQVEDIEEDFGIGISVIHKALTEGVWVRLYGEGIVHVDKPISLRGIDRPGEVYHFSLMYEVSYNTYQELPLTEFGRLWALTKEELL